MVLRDIWDPRTKLVMVICISTLAVVYSEPMLLLGLLFSTFVILLYLKVDLKQVYYRLKGMIAILILLMFVQSVFSPDGQTLIELNHLPLLTTGGMMKGLSVGIRMGVILSSALILSTINAYDLMRGLVQWKVPYEIAFMVFISAKFLPILAEEATDTFTAIQMRGVDFAKISWREKAHVYTSLLVPIIFGTMVKAQRLAITMEARGARAYPRRTYMRQLVMKKQDKIWNAIFVGGSSMLLMYYFFASR